MASDQTAFDVFRSYRVSSGQMLCFHGPQLEKYGESLRSLTTRGWVVKERFDGAYSLTEAGFRAMQESPACFGNESHVLNAPSG